MIGLCFDFLFMTTSYGFVQRFALPALGRAAERRPAGKMLRRRKLIEIRSESPASGARFVGRTAYYRDYDFDYSLKIKRGHDF